MCRANVESSMKDGQQGVGRGLNTGILYMMSIPYLLGGVAGLIWWRNRKKAQVPG